MNELILSSQTDIVIAPTVSQGVRVFADYMARQSKATRKSQAGDLRQFAEFINLRGQMARSGAQLQGDASAWVDVGYMTVSDFVYWLLGKGYSTGTIARRLATIKAYTRLALQCCTIPTDEFVKIETVRSYNGKEAMRIDQLRAERGIEQRVGNKKAQHVSISKEQAEALKDQPTISAQGRRDRLLLCLLIDHGLRIGEVALLTTQTFDLRQGTMRFYRPKVDKLQTHRLSADTKAALRLYLGSKDAPADPSAPILRSGNSGKRLVDGSYTIRSMQYRIAFLGRRLGIASLSPHDFRHYWATSVADGVRRGKYDILTFQEAGGWSSLRMPRQYVEWAQIANEGLV